ncbi:MAG: hypothetical protein ACP5OO_13245 [Chloroflexia bacterium]
MELDIELDEEEFRRNGFSKFRKAKRLRWIYKGREIWGHHWFPIADGERVRIIIESFDTDWGGLGKYCVLQGVWLLTDKTVKIGEMSCRLLTIWPYPPPVEILHPIAEKLYRIEFGSVHAEGGIKSRLCLWLDDPFRPVEVVGRTRDGHIHVYNAWQFRKPGERNGIWIGQYGAGMLVEEIENGFRYRCNDGYPDLDFNDIVFRIERCER